MEPIERVVWGVIVLLVISSYYWIPWVLKWWKGRHQWETIFELEDGIVYWYESGQRCKKCRTLRLEVRSWDGFGHNGYRVVSSEQMLSRIEELKAMRNFKLYLPLESI